MSRLLAVFASVTAIGFGLITLIGVLAGSGSGIFHTLSSLFLQLAMIAVAFTILLGIGNLLGVHFRRITGRKTGWVYSLVLIISALAVLVLWLTGADSTNMLLLESVQVSLEASLAGLVLFALVLGAARMMQRRVSLGGVLFTIVILIVLLGALPLPEMAPLADVRAWLMAVPVSAGARGILLGIALATVVTGIRVFIGQDRSFRE
jgi:hypothetical protein